MQPNSNQNKIKYGMLYQYTTKHYWVLDNDEKWISLGESSAKRHIKAWLKDSSKDEGEVRDIEDVLYYIQMNQSFAHATAIAGYDAGYYKKGPGILVTTSPNRIQPVKGDFSTFHKLIYNLFGEEQLPYFLGWLKVGVQAFVDGRKSKGQAIVLAGEANSGKSLLQNLITEIYGGRSPAKPYKYMIDATGFNSDLFKSEHLMIEDEAASRDIRTKSKMSAAIKQITANDTQRYHAKFGEPFTLSPFWRLSISVNDEPENLEVLPLIEDSLEDKMMLFKVYKNMMPMPTNTDEDQRVFWDQLISEIPALLHYLIHDFEIPKEMQCSRFGVKAYHNSELLGDIHDLSPENKLLEYVDELLTSSGDFCEWRGTADELKEQLCARADGMKLRAIEKLLSYRNVTGNYLARLMKRFPERISQKRTNKNNQWVITGLRFEPKASGF